MKKILVLLLMVSSILVLNACDEGPSPLLFSKYFESTSTYGMAIEIHNPSESSVSLNNHKIDIYSNGSLNVTYSISLSGTIEAGGFYVISNTMASNEELKSKSDLQDPNLIFNGDDAISLKYKDSIIDLIGTIGSSSQFGVDVTLIRPTSRLTQRTVYDSTDYIPYLPDLYSFLKTFEGIITIEELLDGPLLTDEYRELPFIDPNDPSKGGGGVLEVRSISVSDGDTVSVITTEGTSYRVRFYWIDTKEVTPGNQQPWGHVASALMKNIIGQALSDGLTIEIQTIIGGSLYDNYDRVLGLVWVDGRLANFYQVRAAMSDAGGTTISHHDMSYNQIAYHGYLIYAWNRAIKFQWGIHGQNDSNWDYTAGRPVTTNTEYPNSPIVPDFRLYDPEIDS